MGVGGEGGGGGGGRETVCSVVNILSPPISDKFGGDWGREQGGVCG